MQVKSNEYLNRKLKIVSRESQNIRTNFPIISLYFQSEHLHFVFNLRLEKGML